MQKYRNTANEQKLSASCEHNILLIFDRSLRRNQILFEAFVSQNDFFHIRTCRCIWTCVFLLYAVAIASSQRSNFVTAFIPEHIITNSSNRITVTPSVHLLILNRQIYNKMEINGSHWVVYYQWKPPGLAMALIATAA